ncbi:MAG TPA: hypothetical protein VI382_03140 [Candidatus Manganitrophaceae bacterium]|nr:hypothetical protein [Candidatus Manganitrophaceae bacterium]
MRLPPRSGLRRSRRADHRGWVAALFFLLLLVENSDAGTIGSPAAAGRPATLSQLNLEYDTVQRDMNSNDRSFSGDVTSERILLQGVFGLTPYTDFFLRVGAADLETASRGFNSGLGVAYGGGGRWTVLKKGDLKIGLGLQFLEFLGRDADAPISKVHWDELETFVGGEIEGLERFTPYFGVSFSKAVGRFKGGPGATVRSDDFIGLFVGAEYQIYQNYYLSSEARLIHENALTIRVNYHL